MTDDRMNPDLITEMPGMLDRHGYGLRIAPAGRAGL